MTHTIIGWDIGGAHLKAALIDTTGNALQVVQVACPLWHGLKALALAIDEVLAELHEHNPNIHDAQIHAITMTGELADIFPDRHTGVIQIANLLDAKLNGKKHYYAGRHGFIEFAQVTENTVQIASANWLASAQFVAQKQSQALLIDMGSTTTDFVVIANGQPQCRGFNDATRMRFEELVYTGMIRTPLMAVAGSVPFAGEWYTVAAEHFATMADVYRLTGELAEAEDMSDTADGGGKTMQDSARRVARMLGHDLADVEIAAWIGLAHVFKQTQLNTLKKAAMRHFSRYDLVNSVGIPGLLDTDAPIVGAGAGVEVVRALTQQLNRPFIRATDMIAGSSLAEKNWAGVCFPAYAVANLALHL